VAARNAGRDPEVRHMDDDVAVGTAAGTGRGDGAR